MVVIEQWQWHLLFWGPLEAFWQTAQSTLYWVFHIKACGFWEPHYQPTQAVMFNHQLFG